MMINMILNFTQKEDFQIVKYKYDESRVINNKMKRRFKNDVC